MVSQPIDEGKNNFTFAGFGFKSAGKTALKTPTDASYQKVFSLFTEEDIFQENNAAPPNCIDTSTPNTSSAGFGTRSATTGDMKSTGTSFQQAQNSFADEPLHSDSKLSSTSFIDTNTYKKNCKTPVVPKPNNETKMKRTPFKTPFRHSKFTLIAVKSPPKSEAKPLLDLSELKSNRLPWRYTLGDILSRPSMNCLL
ncbi:hypothetical protein BC829DRAFT_106846 [Chytridium lagenaria]|nr:hypothetical protein BC829DRAFT_106846 [Chytridium lagenaria]